MNSIATRQNLEVNITRLAAQRRLYSVVKILFYSRTVIAVALAVLGPLVGAAKPELKTAIAALALCFVLIDLFLENGESSRRTKAAKIQEMFDCDVLEIPWNEIAAGKKVDAEDVRAASKKIKNLAAQKLDDWYPPETSKIDITIARIICQRANVSWDTKLRRFFAHGYVIALVILIGISLKLNWDQKLSDFILNISPVIPLLKILIQQMVSQYRTAGNTDNIKTQADALIADAECSVDPLELTMRSRSLQDEIYRHRKSAQPIPDVVYWIFRNAFEDEMGYSASNKVAEILKESSS